MSAEFSDATASKLDDVAKALNTSRIDVLRRAVDLMHCFCVITSKGGGFYYKPGKEEKTQEFIMLGIDNTLDMP